LSVGGKDRSCGVSVGEYDGRRDDSILGNVNAGVSNAGV